MRLLGGGLPALCMAAAVCGLAACGSGGSDFASEANTVCKDQAAKSVAIYESPDASSESRQGAIQVQRRYLALDEKTNRELKVLEAPASAQKNFAAFLGAREAAAAHDRELLAAAKEGNPKKYSALTEKSEEEGRAVDKAAAAVGGLEACADELPEAEAEEVAETIERNETEANPAQCTDYFSEMAVKQQWETAKGCREFQENETAKEIARAVDVKVTEGVAGVRATAEATFHGGIMDGRTLELGLAREGGNWKVIFGKPKEG
ncbi:MAG TPA: hypothetical protein VFK14_09045 [Solirubrobacterales bacterium]|nr:hypothetical protein [Solirubrobacterales bacterium]